MKNRHSPFDAKPYKGIGFLERFTVEISET
jgi:hypothetical protein